MISRELTNPVFTDIALGANHTCKAQFSKLQNLFLYIIFSEINLKNYVKTDDIGVLAGEPPDFFATSLLIPSFDKFNFVQTIESLYCRDSSQAIFTELK